MPVVTGAIAKNPDMILIGNIGGDSASMIRTVGEAGYQGVVGSSQTGVGLERILEQLKGVEHYAEGFYDVEWVWHPPTPELQAFKDEYAKRNPTWAVNAINGYLMTIVLFQALQDAGTVTDVDKIVEAMENVKVEHPLFPEKPIMSMGGKKTLGQRHQLQYQFALNRVKDGKPSSIKLLEAVYP
jgi:branched-chain amino acid transport system substrate-binding protein